MCLNTGSECIRIHQSLVEGKKLAYRSVRVSDLTGKEDSDDKFVTLVVRKAPGLVEPVQLDVLPSEIAGLKGAGDLVVLEIKNGETTQLVVTLSEFKKLSPDIEAILAKADGLRGRRKGYKPASQA
jgi:hypothetical protein